MTLGMEVVGSKTSTVSEHMEALPMESQQGSTAIECGLGRLGQVARAGGGARIVKVGAHSGMDG